MVSACRTPRCRAEVAEGQRFCSDHEALYRRLREELEAETAAGWRARGRRRQQAERAEAAEAAEAAITALVVSGSR